jgi:hypothetical protein
LSIFYISIKFTFRKLDLLPSSGKKEGKKPYLLGPLVELASDLDQVREVGCPTGRVSLLPEDRRRSNFRNVVNFIEI